MSDSLLLPNVGGKHNKVSRNNKSPIEIKPEINRSFILMEKPMKRLEENLKPVNSVEDYGTIDLSNIKSADLKVPKIKSFSNERGGRR